METVEKQLVEARAGVPASSSGAFVSDTKQPAKKNQFDTRRTKYVGPHTVLDGVAYDWCDKGHKSSASPNGMYMPEGHDHEEWLKKKLLRRSRGSGSSTSAEDSSTKQVNFAPSDNSKSIKLTLSEQLKTCLMSKAGFSVEEADAIFKDMDLN